MESNWRIVVMVLPLVCEQAGAVWAPNQEVCKAHVIAVWFQTGYRNVPSGRKSDLDVFSSETKAEPFPQDFDFYQSLHVR